MLADWFLTVLGAVLKERNAGQPVPCFTFSVAPAELKK